MTSSGPGDVKVCRTEEWAEGTKAVGDNYVGLEAFERAGCGHEDSGSASPVAGVVDERYSICLPMVRERAFREGGWTDDRKLLRLDALLKQLTHFGEHKPSLSGC